MTEAAVTLQNKAIPETSLGCKGLRAAGVLVPVAPAPSDSSDELERRSFPSSYFLFNDNQR